MDSNHRSPARKSRFLLRKAIGRWDDAEVLQQAEVRFARDSPLEEGGFELPVPLSRKGLSGLPKGDAGPIGQGGGH